ncbi:MAG: BNR repeat-containing protein [Thermoguttaceae bacterium]|nr:BNR repeat-containing protein [Thermoguttaceae bacterium]MDW8038457.1 BNR-4 repeat-containing protein [Thermoguttaceae bacterium]
MGFFCFSIHLGVVGLRTLAAPAEEVEPLPVADGYRGIWYWNERSGDQYKYKYSGGLATYPQQHVPIACYSAKAQKTFFVYGGRAPEANRLWHMVSYFDHRTKTVPRPRILLDKKTDDAHDNPSLLLDDQGYLWIFSNAHGTARAAYIHRSTQPFSIERFERIATTNFSYSQPWYVPGQGFCLLHTHYERGGRSLFVWLSADGRRWSDRQPLARIEMGNYQISWQQQGGRIGTALDYHPQSGGVNARTNLYYLETRDGGRTWTTVDGQPLRLPLTEVQNPALVHDYASEKRLVYLKDLTFDTQGRPVILYLTSRHYASGPEGNPRIWHTAHWTGQRWQIRPVCQSDHNYDHGSLYIEPDGTWRLIAPTDPGPQPYTTGGEMVLWKSTNEGATWTKIKQLTRNSSYNHTYARRPLGAHPDFYALWADGHTLQQSESRLYFTDRDGTHVWRLPVHIDSDQAKPEPAW